MKYFFILTLLFSSFGTLSATKADQIFLYLPDYLIKERVVDQQQFMQYVGTVKTTLISELDNKVNGVKFSFGLIVGVRPNNESKIWYKFIEGDIGDSLKSEITKKIQSISVPNVIGGVMPFAIAVSSDNSMKRFDSAPIHESWIQNGIGGEISELINKSWH